MWWGKAAVSVSSRIGSSGSQSSRVRQWRAFFRGVFARRLEGRSNLQKGRYEAGLTAALELLTEDLGAVLEATSRRMAVGQVRSRE